MYCTLTREQATLYEAVVRDSMRQIEEAEGIQRRGLVLAHAHPAQAGLQPPGAASCTTAARCRGAAASWRGWPRCWRRSSPAASARWSSPSSPRWAGCCSTLQRRSAARCCSCTAAHPLAERDRMVAALPGRRRTAPPLFILSLKAGGTGLNLTRANHVFHFDRWWNPAVENQATDRAFRIGQTRNVQVHKYVCAGTFEETLDELIERKVALAEAIVGHERGLDHRAEHRRAARLFALRRAEAVAAEGRDAHPVACDGKRERSERLPTGPNPVDWRHWRRWEYRPAAPPRDGIKARTAARRVRQDLVGRPLDRRAGAAGQLRPPVARALLRPQRPGDQAGRRPRRGRRPSCRAGAPALRGRDPSSSRLTDAEWERVVDAMAGRGAVRRAAAQRRDARADRGGVPPAGASLFPASRGDLLTHCSCPDCANPCKHVAAVHYLLGERFDDDPFLMFELRGRSKEQIVAALRERRTDGDGAASTAATLVAPAPEAMDTDEPDDEAEPPALLAPGVAAGAGADAVAAAFWSLRRALATPVAPATSATSGETPGQMAAPEGAPDLDAMTFTFEPPPVDGLAARVRGAPHLAGRAGLDARCRARLPCDLGTGAPPPRRVS